MSLGWMNLVDYLNANRGAADELASTLDAQQQQAEEAAVGEVQQGRAAMSLGEYEARARSMRQARATDEGRAALLGGTTSDAFLAGRGQSGYTPTADFDAMRKSQARRQQESDEYWRQQAARNQASQAEREKATKTQREGFAQVRDAYVKRHGDPETNRRYSDAVKRSFDEAYRTRDGVRRISKEEEDAWNR